MLIYVAGPYRSTNGKTVDENIAAARKVAVELWRAGYAVICPHLNCAHMEHDQIADEVVLAGDIEMLRRCDAVCMVEGWAASRGATHEKEVAEFVKIPIYFSTSELAGKAID